MPKGTKHARARASCRKQTRANTYIGTGASTHTPDALQGLRECARQLERVGCYLFISLSCSQEATSARSCKHRETRASARRSPGNNKWSPHISARTTCGMPAQTSHPHAGLGCPDSRDAPTSFQGLKQDKRKPAPDEVSPMEPAYVNHRSAATKEQQT